MASLPEVVLRVRFHWQQFIKCMVSTVHNCSNLVDNVFASKRTNATII